LKVETRSAMPMGYGVPTIKPNKSATTPGGKEQVISVDGLEEWLDTPTIPDQLDTPEFWKSDGIEAKLFDVSNAEDLKMYNDLLSKVDMPNSNVFFREHKVEAFQAQGTWKVFVLIQKVKFRKLIVKKDTK